MDVLLPGQRASPPAPSLYPIPPSPAASTALRRASASRSPAGRGTSVDPSNSSMKGSGAVEGSGGGGGGGRKKHSSGAGGGSTPSAAGFAAIGGVDDGSGGETVGLAGSCLTALGDLGRGRDGGEAGQGRVVPAFVCTFHYNHIDMILGPATRR